MKNTPNSNGSWTGTRGNSKWIPDKRYTPKKFNKTNKTWEQILNDYDIDGIKYTNGYPDFSPVSKGNVEIKDFSAQRYGKGGNFDKADIELARIRTDAGKPCTADDVTLWREQHKYTWHEEADCKSMKKVPLVIHGNMSHNGGISTKNKMKKKFAIFFIQLFISTLFALDYRQVLFSNNFERIEQINDENIVNNYLNKIKQSYIKIVSNEPFRVEYRELKYFRLYKEIFENIVIYRLVGCSEKITDTNIENQNLKNISQLIFYENTGNIYLIDYAVFHYTPEGGGMYTAYFTDDYYGLETIERSNNLKGIMKHHSENMKEVHSDEDSSQKTINYSGFSNAKYYEWSDLQNPKKYALISSNVYLFDSYNNHIEIHSTRPLIDKKRPLMYTIQNAFDGNPATAYVEDTGSSNIGITIKMKEERSLLMLAIINGYGENIDLYKANNSIKELEIGDDYSTNEVIKLNNIVDIQKLPTKAYKNSSFCVFSRNLYKGTKYDDTCIAELNLCFKKFGWFIEE